MKLTQDIIDSVLFETDEDAVKILKKRFPGELVQVTREEKNKVIRVGDNVAKIQIYNP